MINDNILALIDITPDSIAKGIAERVRCRRLERNWTQKLLAARAGIPLATYRRFESEGEISMRNLVLIGIALNAEDDFIRLFSTENYQSLDELLSASENKKRKRGGKNE